MPHIQRVRPPPWYLPPSPGEMAEAAARVGLKAYSPGFLADLACLGAGGEVVPPAPEAVLAEAQRHLRRYSGDGVYVLPDGGSTGDVVAATGAWGDKLFSYHAAVGDFLRGLDPAKMPGDTPLEKAAVCLKMLAKMAKRSDGGGTAGGEEPLLPVFSDEKTGGGRIADALEEAVSTAEQLSEEEREMLGHPGKPGDGLTEQRVAEDLLPGQDGRVLLEISRVLDARSDFRVRRTRKLTPDPRGRRTRVRPATLGELPLTPAAAAYAAGGTARKAALLALLGGEVFVPERCRQEEKRQFLFLLVDCSGSMAGSRHLRASGVVMNRLKAVMTGDAAVVLGLFDGGLHRPLFGVAETPDQAKALVEKFRRANFSGGSTDTAAAVRSALQEAAALLEARPDLHRPELVVVTDDDGSVGNIGLAELVGWKLHGFAMSVYNPSLRRLAEATGGVCYERF